MSQADQESAAEPEVVLARLADPPARPPELPAFAPPGMRELAALAAIVAVADQAIYAGMGYAGAAVLFAVAPFLFWFGSPRPRWSRVQLAIVAMSLAVSARLVWLGNPLQIGVGVALLLLFGMAMVGATPQIRGLIVYLAGAFLSGLGALAEYVVRLFAWRFRPKGPTLAAIVLPVFFVALFAAIFVMANPDIRLKLSTVLSDFFSRFWEIIGDWIPRADRVLFWLAVAWLAGGMIRPVLFVRFLRISETMEAWSEASNQAAPQAEVWYYRAYRNTLIAVTALFACYLVFEFYTQWQADFPIGFYYGGYAHEGAAWLTIALAVATLTLSGIFRGRVLGDPRVGRLKRWARIWSIENFALAAAVFGRLNIYVQFNGLTFMRMVGYAGVTAVVIGFCLIVWKVRRDRDFAWVVQRQMAALGLIVFLFAVAPIDWLVTAYNVRAIRSGQLAPSVQIVMHPLDWDAVALLPRLADCKDPIIREGILAMLADRAERLTGKLQAADQRGWTAWQGSERRAARVLARSENLWKTYAGDPDLRHNTIERYRYYAYQWW